MNAGDVMTREMVTVAPETPVAEIVRLLLSHGISGVPVVDDGRRVVGVVSEGDLLRRAELGTEKRRGGWKTFFTGTENSMVVTDGVVHLWGVAAGPEESRALELLAGRVPGVAGVRNHLVLMSEIPYLTMPGPVIG